MQPATAPQRHHMNCLRALAAWRAPGVAAVHGIAPTPSMSGQAYLPPPQRGDNGFCQEHQYQNLGITYCLDDGIGAQRTGPHITRSNPAPAPAAWAERSIETAA
jgi:hypothetical protein